MGLSMGGYLAPRAAAGEPRLAFLIANPGDQRTGAPAMFLSKIEGDQPDDRPPEPKEPARPGLVDGGRSASPGPFLMWGLTDTMWKHGARPPLGHAQGHGAVRAPGRPGSHRLPDPHHRRGGGGVRPGPLPLYGER
ncbi:MAG: hypothetical protein MZV65_15830 [Chromatiales bacterium]|nr:hypothetical protein [Chromatiales bacterium]